MTHNHMHTDTLKHLINCPNKPLVLKTFLRKSKTEFLKRLVITSVQLCMEKSLSNPDV